jgi:hypothetical protein
MTTQRGNGKNNRNGKNNGEIQGSLHCATDDETVRRCGRDDVFSLRDCGLAGLEDERVGEAEADDGFGGDLDVAVAGEAASQGAATTTGQTADEQADSASGDTADQHTRARAAADEGRRTLALTLFGASEIVGVDAVADAVEGERDEAQLEDGAALEVATAMSGVDDACDRSAAGDEDAAVGACLTLMC